MQNRRIRLQEQACNDPGACFPKYIKLSSWRNRTCLSLPEQGMSVKILTPCFESHSREKMVVSIMGLNVSHVSIPAHCSRCIVATRQVKTTKLLPSSLKPLELRCMIWRDRLGSVSR
ncbi:hypothetical protein VTI74DRAFT_11136 [Chaetomium olivicolor]